MAGAPGEFAGVLRELRARARLTQQALADDAGVNLRTVSDLERGAALTPQRETVRLLADALGVTGADRARFETAARGRPLNDVPAVAAATRSLPRGVASFTGRQRELEALVKSAAVAGAVVSIHAIGGMAGVGKTTFAVHAAHQLASQFQGGQVFLPLHGHTPGRVPVDPADALASLLLAVGVPPRQIPPGLELRAALWRNEAAGKPLLLVLDDAASSEQVQPLLPGAGSSLVLVTSRRHLSALDDATVISLDTLPPAEAAELLVRLAGRAGLSRGDPGVTEIARLCGYLPLAVGLLARQLRHHPAWSAAGRAAELASARDRLGLMEAENRSVAAAFGLSYATLSPGQQGLFRRLGLHPGADIDGYAAAALDGTGLAAARRHLEALYDQHLLTEPVRGRYLPHDLIREHARTLAAEVDPQDERDAATARLLDYYQYTAAVANRRIARYTRPGPAAPGAVPAQVPPLPDQERSMTWLRTERANLQACLDHAAGSGQHSRVTALTAGLSAVLSEDGPPTEAVTRHQTAAQAARQLGDQLREANALSDLALATWQNAADRSAALQFWGEALSLYRAAGDQLGQANALRGAGIVHAWTDDYPVAARAAQEALDLYRAVGDRAGQAAALVQLGAVRAVTGDYPAAVVALEEALSFYRAADDRIGQANALVSLADLRRMTGEYPDMERAVREALRLCRELGNRIGQANALSSLGVVLRLTGDFPAAARALDQSIGLYRDIGDRGGEVEALNERGTLHRLDGALASARNCHQQSLDLSREIDSSWDEAHALAGLGRCARAGGQAVQAETLLRQALEIFQRIGAGEAPALRAELDALVTP